MTQRRVALVTGGSQRVGRAIVEGLADNDFNLLFTYNNSETQARELVASLTGAGVKAAAMQVNLLNPDVAAASLLQKVTNDFGRLDLLVNNASIFETSSLGTVTVAQLRRLWTIHAEAPLMICQSLAPLLRASRGHIINMIDLLAETPAADYVAYSASKAAMMNLTRSLARELAPQVTVNAIAPGVVDWPEGFPQSRRDQYLKRVPLGRAGTPGDVAALVCFLCTAGDYITGQILRLDGGRSVT